MKASIQGKDNAIKKLRMQISQLKETCSDADRTLDFRALEFQITLLTEQVTVLQEQNELFKDENAKIKQHYKELYDSIKITRAKHIDQTIALLSENENLKAQLHENLKCITIDSVKPRVLALGSVETLREMVDEAKVERPLDRSLASAFLYTKHFQELLEFMIGTCPKDFNKRDKKYASTHLTRKKQVTFEDHCETSNNNTHKHVEQLNIQKTNVPVIPSTGVNSCTETVALMTRLRPAPTFLTSGQISLGLVSNLVFAAPYVPLTNKDLEILFQPMFDEYLEPPCVERPVSPALAFPVLVNSVGIPSSTTIDQDTPSPSHSSSSSELQSPSSQQGIADGSTNNEDNPFSPVDNAPFINVFASEPSYEASSSGDASSAESTYVTQTHHHLEK
ncbi:hypothetical protein Tco_1349707 [Tanacetum coccineum]